MRGGKEGNKFSQQDQVGGKNGNENYVTAKKFAKIFFLKKL